MRLSFSRERFSQNLKSRVKKAHENLGRAKRGLASSGRFLRRFEKRKRRRDGGLELYRLTMKLSSGPFGVSEVGTIERTQLGCKNAVEFFRLALVE